MLEFTHREPIGSSTFPMPGNPVDMPKTLEALSGEVSDDRRKSTLYIHIPFCDQICSFCAFNKAVSNEAVKNQYVKALVKEMEMYGRMKYVSGLDIQAVYIGGGTPNSLSNEDLKVILEALHKNFPLSKRVEITCEGTPQNFTAERNQVLKAGGVTRVSAGIQTFNRDIRNAHLHMNDGEYELQGYIAQIREDFPNFNLDMIYNLPGQTDEIWKRDLKLAIESGSRHLTVYPLVLLENTIFYSDYVKNERYAAPAEDREIDLFKYTHSQLLQNGYGHPYSIRDYAWMDSEYECRYIRLNAESNQILALGAGAHGYLAGQTYKNIHSTKNYIRALLQDDALPLEGQCFLTPYQEMQRFMVMGLRLETLDVNRFEKRFGQPIESVYGDKIDTLIESGYLIRARDMENYGYRVFMQWAAAPSPDDLCHTEKGIIYANNIRTYFEDGSAKSVGYTNTLSVGETGKDHYSSISRVKASVDVESGNRDNVAKFPTPKPRG